MTYSNTLALGRQQMAQRAPAPGVTRGQNSVSFSITDKRLGPVSNTIILIVLACLLGLLYLTQVTKTNTYGYQINGLQQQQSKLQQQHEDLTVASARSQSLDQPAAAQQAAGMTPVTPSGSVQ